MSKSLLVFAFLLFTFNTFAQNPVQYNISFKNAKHHQANIEVVFTNIQTDTLYVWMSRSSPGRYAIHEFAKNVFDVKATDSKGNALSIYRPNPYQWAILQNDGTVNINYTLFADRPDGTYSGIDELYAHLNMPATFMWAKGFENNPIELTFNINEYPKWTIATQLKHLQDNIYTAPNLQYFMDSPTHIGENKTKTWQAKINGEEKQFEFILDHRGTNEELEIHVAKVKKVVNEALAIYRDIPDFDFGKYTFIATYGSFITRGGMEHRNSTIINSKKPLNINYYDNFSTIAHEFFHSYNVERIRPKSLEPFDFTKANMSGELWFAEGVTNYYDDLIVLRAGIIDLKEYLIRISRTLNYVLNSPGTQFYSPIEMSYQAPFVDAATSKDPFYKNNIHVSYYYYGELIGLALDMELRKNYHSNLDDYMKAVWEIHGKTEIPYTLSDLEKILADLTKDSTFAQNFFTKHIYGHELPDYKKLLAYSGLNLQKASPKATSIGFDNFSFDNGMVINDYTLIGSPLYNAGLDKSDIIISIGGIKTNSHKSYKKVLNKYKPGNKTTITYKHKGVSHTSNIIFEALQTLEINQTENPDQALIDFRNGWMKKKY